MSTSTFNNSVGNIFTYGAGQIGGFAPGAVVVGIGAVASIFGMPPRSIPIVNILPLEVWGAAAGYTFGSAIMGDDPTCAALKGFAGAVGARVVVRMIPLIL